MDSNRFLRAVGFSALASLATSSLPAASWAQTAPVLDAPRAGAKPGAASGTLLLDNAFDFEPEAAEAPQPPAQTPPSTATITNDEAASGAKALSWKYTAGREEPRLSWKLEKPLDLSGAKSVGLKVKSDAGAAIEIWFETEAQGEGAEATSTRYSTTVWSAGGKWQEVSIDTARFTGHEVRGGKAQKAPIATQMWDLGWGSIARWGVADASNTWRLFAGQTRLNGPRTLWIDDLKLSTAASPNPARPVFEAPQPQPQPAPQPLNNGDGEDEEDFGPNPNGFDGPNGFDPRNDPRNNPQFNPQFGQGFGQGQVPRGAPQPGEAFPGQFGPQPEPQFGPEGAPQPGDFEDDEPNWPQPQQPQQQRPEPVQVQAVVQDAWGALDSWIPINGTTEPLAGARSGLKWSMVRLANRDAMLFSTVNPELLSGFPPESTRRKPREANVVIGGPERLLRLAIAVKSAKPTTLQVALYESDGGVWVAPIPIDKVILGAVPVVNLADMKNAPTKRDANGQLDLDKVVAISIQDLGAQKNLSGPNEITLRGLTWIY